MESTFLACRALSGCSAHSLPGSMDKLLIFPSTFLPRQQSKAMWRKGPFVKLAPGTYVARLIGDEVPGLPQHRVLLGRPLAARHGRVQAPLVVLERLEGRAPRPPALLL